MSASGSQSDEAGGGLRFFLFEEMLLEETSILTKVNNDASSLIGSEVKPLLSLAQRSECPYRPVLDVNAELDLRGEHGCLCLTSRGQRGRSHAALVLLAPDLLSSATIRTTCSWTNTLVQG